MKKSILNIAAISIFISGIAFGQTQQDDQQQRDQQLRAQPRSSNVIDLDGIKLERNQELPQAIIIAKRKTTNFDAVKVERDFKNELSGRYESVQMVIDNRKKARKIRNLKALVNKSRF